MGNGIDEQDEYYLTVYSSTMELIMNLEWKDLRGGISESVFQEEFAQNCKQYAEFLKSADEEEEQIKKNEIFSFVGKLQLKLAGFEERLKSLHAGSSSSNSNKSSNSNDSKNGGKFRFADVSFSSLSLGDMQEFWNEYHILHKHIIDCQDELKTYIGAIQSFEKPHLKKHISMQEQIKRIHEKSAKRKFAIF